MHVNCSIKYQQFEPQLRCNFTAGVDNSLEITQHPVMNKGTYMLYVIYILLSSRQY